MALVAVCATPAYSYVASLSWGEITGNSSLNLAPAVQNLLAPLQLSADLVGAADVATPLSTDARTIDDTSTVNGIRQSGHTTLTTTTTSGGGRVSGEIKAAGTHTYTNVATGVIEGRVTSSARGTFSVSACPDSNGIAAGDLTVELQMDSTRTDSGQRGVVSVFQGPFKLINGDDAKLQRIEAEYQVTAGQHGFAASPGAASGDWGITGFIGVVVRRDGTLTANPTRQGETSSLGPVPEDAYKNTPAYHFQELTLQAIAANAEKFWRSGKCIELKPTVESRETDADEQITFGVNALQKFDGQEVRAPLRATFSGVSSLEPIGAPVVPPGSFVFRAGHNPGERGTISLEQIGKRGIGRRSVEFIVKRAGLRVEFLMKLGMEGDGVRGTIELASPAATLTVRPDGTFWGRSTVSVKGQFGTEGCIATLDFSSPADLVARRDEADSRSMRLDVVPDSPQHPVRFVCSEFNLVRDASVPFASWAHGLAQQPVAIDGTTPLTGAWTIDGITLRADGRVTVTSTTTAR
ncbi:MAG: hypothetical protein ABI771_14570 [Betaproteobacteria bacterium]